MDENSPSITITLPSDAPGRVLFDKDVRDFALDCVDAFDKKWEKKRPTNLPDGMNNATFFYKIVRRKDGMSDVLECFVYDQEEIDKNNAKVCPPKYIAYVSVKCRAVVIE